jgi:hypothetical protein
MKVESVDRCDERQVSRSGTECGWAPVHCRCVLIAVGDRAAHAARDGCRRSWCDKRCVHDLGTASPCGGSRTVTSTSDAHAGGLQPAI